MYTMNQLTIIGFTGNDAASHYTANGTLITTLSIATKESWKDADDQWNSRTDWHRVVSFAELRNTAARFRRDRMCWCRVPFAPGSTNLIA
jgi:single-strand DNA-binding protein